MSCGALEWRVARGACSRVVVTCLSSAFFRGRVRLICRGNLSHLASPLLHSDYSQSTQTLVPPPHFLLRWCLYNFLLCCWCSEVAGRCPSGSSISSSICLHWVYRHIFTHAHTHTHIQTYFPISKPTAITPLAENCDHPYLPICPPPSVSLLLHSSASTPRSNRDWKCPASSPSSLRQIQSRPHMPIP